MDDGATTSPTGMSKELRAGRVWARCAAEPVRFWFVILVECDVAEDSLPPGSRLCGP